MSSTRSRQPAPPRGSSIGSVIALAAVVIATTTARSAGWSDAPPLTTQAGPLGPNMVLGPTARPSLSSMSFERHVAIAASETVAVAAWPIPSAVGEAPALAFARSLDGGATWMDPAIVVNADVDGLPVVAVHSPSIATDGAGRWIAVWIATFDQSNALRMPIRAVSTDGGATWSEPALVEAGAATFSIVRWPSVAWLGDETWMIVGQGDGLSNNVRATRSLDGGLTWLTDTSIAYSNPGAGIALASDGAGQAMIGWRASGSLRTAHSDDAGETWSAPVTIAGPDQAQTIVFELALAHDGVSGFIAVWRRGAVPLAVGIPATIETSRSADGEKWSDAAVIDRIEPGETTAHATVAAASGRAVIAWTGTDSRTTGTDFDIFAVESGDGGSTWSDRRVANAGGRGDGADQLFPAVAATATGWVAAWVIEPGRATDVVRTVGARGFGVRGFGVEAPCPVERGGDCDGDLADDACAIALGWLDDCAGLGTPDGCAIAQGLVADCDGDGIPDACAIAVGAADDCDGDGVPDSCQLANYAHAVDAQHWWYFNSASPRDHTIIERFDRRPGVDVLTAVRLRLIAPDPSAPGTALLCVWSDPVGDGNPTDAQLLTSVEFVPDPDPIDSMQTIEIEPVDLTDLPTGHFFVGVVTTRNRSLVAFVEGQPTSRAGRAFLAFTPADQTDPSDLLNTTTLRRLDGATTHFGVWAIAQSSHDLNGDGVIDACQLTGDLNGDGLVDGADLGILLQAWGSAGGPAFADLNGDGVVDGGDLGLLLANWRTR